ncbi:MAG: DUF6763 family protein [Gammaproteobacteria bacterium]
MIDADPTVGSWYELLDRGQKFEVMSVDEDSALIEIQYEDGDTEEIDLDAWYEMEIEPADPPEGWATPDEESDVVELADNEAVAGEDDWRAPVRSGKSTSDDWDEDEGETLDDEMDEFSDDASWKDED